MKNGKEPCPGYGTGFFVFWGAGLFRVFFLRIALGEELVGHVGEKLPLGWLEPGEDGDKLPLKLAVRVADDGHAELRDLLLAGKLQEHLPIAAAQPALRDTKLPADGDNYGIQRNTGTALVGGDNTFL